MNLSFLVYLIEFSICLAAFTILFKVLFKEEKCFTFNRCYLLLIPLVSLLIPKILYNIPIENYANLPQLYYSSTFPQNINIQVEKINQPTQITHWKYLIIAIYVLGVFLSVLQIVKGLLRFNQFTKSADGEVDNGIRKIYIKGLQTPFSMFNTMVLPKNHHWLHLIEQHEQSHCTNKHTWDMLYYELLNALLWFHPLIYILKKWLKEQHEFEADSDVIREYRSKFLYASALVNQSATITKNIIPYANHFNSITVKKRLKMIAKKENRKIVLLKKCMVLPLMLVLLLAFSIHFEVVAQKSTNYQSGKIYTTLESDDPAAKKLKIENIIEEKRAEGKIISEEDIVFISHDELDKIATSSFQNSETATMPKNFNVAVDKSSGKINVSVDGESAELISNTISYTRTIDSKLKEMETTKLTMANGNLPSNFKLDGNNKNVKISNFKLKLKGITKIYKDFYVDITDGCE